MTTLYVVELDTVVDRPYPEETREQYTPASLCAEVIAEMYVKYGVTGTVVREIGPTGHPVIRWIGTEKNLYRMVEVEWDEKYGTLPGDQFLTEVEETT